MIEIRYCVFSDLLDDTEVEPHTVGEVLSGDGYSEADLPIVAVEPLAQRYARESVRRGERNVCGEEILWHGLKG